ALDLVHHVLAVPDDPPELGGPQPRRLAPQLQLPPHRGDDGDAPLVVRVHLPTGLVRLFLEPTRPRLDRPHAAPLPRNRPCRTRRPTRTNRRHSHDSTGQPPDSDRTYAQSDVPRYAAPATLGDVNQRTAESVAPVRNFSVQLSPTPRGAHQARRFGAAQLRSWGLPVDP